MYATEPTLASIAAIGADSMGAMGAIASLPHPKSCGGDAPKSPPRNFVMSPTRRCTQPKRTVLRMCHYETEKGALILT